MAFDDPRTLALLGASAGFLDPRGGMMGGFQGAMQGLQAGEDIKRQKLLDQQQQQKIMQQMQAKQMLGDVLAKQQQAGDMSPVSIGNALLNTGYPELMMQGMGILKDFRSKVKTTVKGLDAKGNPVIHNIMDNGETSSTGITPAEKLMQINQGSQVGLANPYTGQIQHAVGVGMAPGESARLAQSAQQFGASHGLAQQKMLLDARSQTQPKFIDGAWVYPPNAQNPQGAIIPTDNYVPPKGSVASSKASAAKVNGLLDEAERIIPHATGSLVGSVLDSGAGALGVSTEGARGIASLKPIEAGLVMNMPRLEGPQSNLDQQLYREAAGQIGNPNIPAKTKSAAIATIRRIQRTYPDAFGNQQGGVSDPGSDGWGELR